MNKQEIFNKVVEHLFRQGRKAVDNCRCLYRGPGGTMCAAGCLIKDEFYSPALEGMAITSNELACKSLIDSGIGLETHDLVRDLQRVHDVFQPHEWRSELFSVGRNHKLELPECLK